MSKLLYYPPERSQIVAYAVAYYEELKKYGPNVAANYLITYVPEQFYPQIKNMVDDWLIQEDVGFEE